MLMRALTVWQPWASLIVADLKPYEFRGHCAPVFMRNQRFVVHAATRLARPAELLEMLRALEAGEPVLGHRDPEKIARAIALIDAAWPSRTKYMVPKFPYSAGLGTAVLGAPLTPYEVERRGIAEGDPATLNWAWPLSDVEPFPAPVPMKGLQGSGAGRNRWTHRRPRTVATQIRTPPYEADV
jgi:hypothetical protein